MIRIRCRCGEVLHADVQHVGRKVRCRCGRTHTVVVPQTPDSGGTAGWRAAARRLLSRWRQRAAAVLPHSGRRSAAGDAQRPGAASVRGAGGHRPRVVRSSFGDRYPVAARWTRYAALAYLALVLAAAMVVWVFGDRTWFGTVFLFSGRWILLLPLAPILAAAALLHRRSLIPLAAATAIMLFPVMGLRLGLAAARGHGDDADLLRVASFNAAGSVASLQAMLLLMQLWDVDVAVIQECPNQPGSPAAGELQLHTDGRLCTISRHPIRLRDRLDLDDVVPRNRTFGGTGMAGRYDMELRGRTVAVVNVHLETARRGLRGLSEGDLGRMANNLALRGVESRATAAWIGDALDDAIVAGDFNMPVESAIYRASWGGLTNAFSRAGRGFGFTRDNGWIRVRIDHVLSGRNWQPVRAWVGPDIGSDHRPVFADLVRSAP